MDRPRAHHKYDLGYGAGEYIIEMPSISTILKVAEQRGGLCVWALVKPDDMEKYNMRFKVFATGQEVDDYDLRDWDYLDTVLMANGLVWHVWYR